MVGDGVQGFDQLGPFDAELLEDRSHQLAGGREGVAATVEARFDPVLGYPDSTLGQVLALNECRAVVAHLEDDALAQMPVLIREEVVELAEVAEQARIQPCGEHHRCVEVAVGEPAQPGQGIAELCGALLLAEIRVAVQLGHDVDVDGPGHDVLAEAGLQGRPLVLVDGREHCEV